MNISKWYNIQGAKLGIFINTWIKASSCILLIIRWIVITNFFMNLRTVKWYSDLIAKLCFLKKLLVTLPGGTVETETLSLGWWLQPGFSISLWYSTCVSLWPDWQLPSCSSIPLAPAPPTPHSSIWSCAEAAVGELCRILPLEEWKQEQQQACWWEAASCWVKQPRPSLHWVSPGRGGPHCWECQAWGTLRPSLRLAFSGKEAAFA